MTLDRFGLLGLVAGALIGGLARPSNVAEHPGSLSVVRGPTCDEVSTTAEPSCPQPLQSRASSFEVMRGPTCSRVNRNDVSLVSTLEPDGGRGVRAATGLFDFGTLSGHEPQPLGDETMINGAAMRMATLSVPLRPVEVIRRYNAQLRANGVLPLYGKLGQDGPQFLSYQPADSHVHRTIIVTADGDSASTVLFSVGDPSHMLDTQAAIPDALPHPSGITGVVVDEMRDGRQRQCDVAFTWPRHGVPDAKQYYAGELAKAGFRGETSTWNADQTDKWHQSFTRGSETLGLSLDRRDDGVQVSMLWTHT